jgi:hypothetical protein
MKKTGVKKVTLSRETLRQLDKSRLDGVAGGITQRCTNTDACTESCIGATHCSICCP